MVACDFFVVATATFRMLYVFVIMELETRRILHQNVTAHPTAEWTLLQFREALPGDHSVSVRYPRQGQHLLQRVGPGTD
jgi:putative transposase